MIITPENPKNYCIVCNEVARRTDLSARAKGIYYYLATLPPNWELQQQEAEQHFTEGREAFKTAFRELITTGYIIPSKVKDAKGRLQGWKYNVLWSSTEMQETDTPENRNRKNRQTENLCPENPQLLNTNLLNTNLTNTNLTKQEINSDKSENAEFEQIFELFRKKYPGTKRTLETEFTNFTKKHKDWKNIVSLLLPAIQKEIDCRKSYTDANKFYPQQKNLSTWLNNKCWEQELIFNEVIPKKESKPLTDIKFEDVEDYAIELIQNNEHIQKDNFNKSACRVELVNYFNYVKSKNIENWKSAIKTMFNKNVNKFIYA